MTKCKLFSLASVAGLLLVLIASLSFVAAAQSQKVEGIIKGRSGSIMVGHDGHRGWLYYVASTPHSRGSGIGWRVGVGVGAVSAFDPCFVCR